MANPMSDDYADTRRMLSDVSTFHDYMGFYPFAETAPPLEAISKKRGKMLREEVEELIEVIESGDKSKILHEGVDVLYVVLGALVEAGLTGSELSVAWSLVHSANMTKDPPNDPLAKGVKGKDFKRADCSLALNAPGEEHRYAVIANDQISIVSTIGPMTRGDFSRVCLDTYDKTGSLPGMITELA